MGTQRVTADKSIYHKNLMPVTYVTADVAGAMGSPVYAILKLMPEIDQISIPEGYKIEQKALVQIAICSCFCSRFST